MPEDKVNGSYYEAFCVQLVTSVGEKGILIPPKLHAVIALVGGMGRKRKILSICADMPKSVGYIEIIELGVRVPLPDGRGLVIITNVEESKIERYCYSVALVGTSVRGPALDREV